MRTRGSSGPEQNLLGLKGALGLEFCTPPWQIFQEGHDEGQPRWPWWPGPSRGQQRCRSPRARGQRAPQGQGREEPQRGLGDAASVGSCPAACVTQRTKGGCGPKGQVKAAGVRPGRLPAPPWEQLSIGLPCPSCPPTPLGSSLCGRVGGQRGGERGCGAALTKAGHVGGVQAVSLVAEAGEPVGDTHTAPVLTATQNAAFFRMGCPKVLHTAWGGRWTQWLRVRLASPPPSPGRLSALEWKSKGARRPLPLPQSHRCHSR